MNHEYESFPNEKLHPNCDDLHVLFPSAGAESLSRSAVEFIRLRFDSTASAREGRGGGESKSKVATRDQVKFNF